MADTSRGTTPAASGGRRLQVDILTALVSLLVLTIGAVSAYAWRAGRENLDELASALADRSLESIVSKTTDHLAPAARLVEMTASVERQSLAGGATLELDRWTELERHLRAGVEAYPQLAMAYVADRHGNLLLVRRLPDGTFATKRMLRARRTIVDEPAPEGATGTIGVVRMLALEKPETTWTYTDAQGLVLRTETADDSYDARERPWFKGAVETGGTAWSDVYVFHSDHEAGLTASRRVMGSDGAAAVFGADVELGELSSFLASMRIGRTGRAFIVDERLRLVAYPEASQAVRVAGERVEPRAVSELDDAWVAAAADVIGRGGDGAYESDGRRILTMSRAFPAEFGKRWSVVLAVPEDELLGALDRTQRVTLLIALAVLGLAILAAARLSRSISGPIVALTEEARRITAFDFGGGTPGHKVTSEIAEIKDLSKAMASLRGSVSSFAKYVPADVVKELVRTGDEVKVGGERRELTLFFSDIEGFTTLAESLPPEQLLAQMGEYLDELTRIVMEEGGTVDKFIGDAIMAFWNAPQPNEDHAAAACRTALRCQEKLAELGKRWQDAGLSPLVTRIGLATGEVLVGNVGSHERLNYTAIGDTVNLAARLEGANKRYDTRILVSSVTAERVKGLFHLRPVDVVAVKGKRTSTRVYELLGSIGDTTHAVFAERSSDAFELYLKREWDLAQATFEEALELRPDDTVSKQFLGRIEQFREAPPDEGWDGTEHLTSK